MEVLVSLAIFSLLLASGSGILVSSIRAQRRSLLSQELLDQTSYLSEYMSRAIRLARKDINGRCISAKLNYEITRSGKGIKFLNYNGLCQEFYLSGNHLKENKDGVVSNLTSNKLKVISFNIGPSDSWDQEDTEQPRVTFSLKIKGAGEKPESRPEIYIQTTISQRNLDIKY